MISFNPSNYGHGQFTGYLAEAITRLNELKNPTLFKYKQRRLPRPGLVAIFDCFGVMMLAIQKSTQYYSRKFFSLS